MSLPLGSPCPPFEGLVGTDGKRYALADFEGAPLLVIIVSCNHCPYVVAYEERMARLGERYTAKGVALLAVNANDTARYPEDDLAHMAARKAERGFVFPYVRDDSQAFVRALGAKFTPEVFVFERGRGLRYRGRIDDNHREANAVRSHDLADALDALLAGSAPRVAETQAVGCSVKWR